MIFLASRAWANEVPANDNWRAWRYDRMWRDFMNERGWR